MEDKKIIAQLKSLRQIKPDQQWVYLTKGRILGEVELAEKQSLAALFNNLLFQYRMVLPTLIIIGLAGGTLIFAKGSLPGDALYPVKLAAEKGMAALANKDQKPAANLELAEKRLEELNALSEQKKVASLPEAIKEYKSAKATAKKEMADLVRENPKQAVKIAKEVGETLKNIDAKERQVNAILGLEDDATTTKEVVQGVTDDQAIVSALIQNWEQSTLTDDQKNDLDRVKDLYERGQYEKALDSYLRSSLAK